MAALKVLMITSEWPTPDLPSAVPFLVRQVESLRRAGVQLELFPFRGSKNPLRYGRAWLRLRKRLLRNPPQLVHAQWGQSALLALPCPVPLVVTFRGDDVEGIVGPSGRYTWAGRCLARLSRWVGRRADEVIVVSPHLGRKLGREDYHVIPSGLDLKLFRPCPREEARRRLGLPEGPLILFTAANQNPRKRKDLAEAAVRRLQQSLPAQLVVASRVPPEQMPLYLNACDVLLLTSQHEGSPNVVKEALACNLPVVAVEVGDVRQRIEEIPGCFICPPRPEELAQALRVVLQRGERIRGREKVLHLDEEKMTQRVLAVYRRALDRRRAGEEQREALPSAPPGLSRHAG